MRMLLKRLLSPIRVVWLQPIYERLYMFTLYAMNYGGGSFTEDSGEIYVLRRLARQKKSSSAIVVFDVGANVGNYTQLVLKILPAQTEVYGFEPSAITFKKLQSTISTKNVHLYNYGLSDAVVSQPLFADAELSGMTSMYNRQLEHLEIRFKQQEIAFFQTLDGFCTDHVINKIDLLKIDVEGHEMAVLKGSMQMLLAKRIKSIQFEFGGTQIESRVFFRDFWELLSPHYTLYRIVSNGIYRIKKYSEFQEIFVNVNFLAELREV